MSWFFEEFSTPPNLKSSPKRVKKARKSRLFGWEPETSQDDSGDNACQSSDLSDPVISGHPRTLIDFPLLDLCIEEKDASKLEAYAKTAETVLDGIHDALQKAADAHDASRLLFIINRVKAQSKQVRTVVGVIGDTGSGKSSIINALLDEEMLVPTNCMRACTAVITELSYNYSDDPAAKYRAEIEFLSAHDWMNELTQLYHDLLDPSGEVLKEHSDPETEAGVAWAKIKAVYPQLTKDTLSETSVSELLVAPEVQAVLGTQKVVVESRPNTFFEDMQKFIDSDEKAGQQKSSGEKKQFENWPLIKVVRIFVKADALSTGAVIVDLPGSHDSNAARAAVAEKYRETCNSIWVVAPITRAVDDKTFHKLISKTFKLQLKLDCKYDYLTCICSKTDDILIAEAAKSFESKEDVAGCQRKLAVITPELRNSQKKCDDIDNERAQVVDLRDQLQDQIDHWQKQAENLDKGIAARDYSTSSKKRRNPSRRARALKKMRIDLDHQENYIDDDHRSSVETDIPIKQEDLEDEGGKSSEETAVTLTIEHVSKELERLRDEKSKAIDQLNRLDSRFNQAFDLCEANTNTTAMLRTKLKSLCIQSRNEYSKNAIRHDFSRGLKESDQEFAIRENEELFDPQQDIRDYDAIGASLPVFCVSSRAYQKGSGRLKTDERVKGFPNLEDTGIPQLKAHAKCLTEPARAELNRKSLKNFKHFIETLSFWSQDDGSRSELTEEQKLDQVAVFKKDLASLEEELKSAVKSTVIMCRSIISLFIYSQFNNSVNMAAQAAIPTVERWFASRHFGGLAWNTIRSICIRDGAHKTKSAGFRDLNEELVTPFKQCLANFWERAFTNRIPGAIARFDTLAQGIVEKFHQSVKDRVPDKDHDVLYRSLRNNVNYEDIFADFQESIASSQQEANRSFTRAIASNMATVYRACESESGKKMFSRMRVHMLTHVEANRESMFRDATEDVRAKLDNLCSELESGLNDRVEECIGDITFDFESGIIGSNLAENSKAARAQIYQLLQGADALFKAPEPAERVVICLDDD